MKKYLSIGMLVGFLNGFFGGGGGAILVPLLLLQKTISPQQALATSIVVIAGLCACSVLCYSLQGQVPWGIAFPYCIGGCLGGLLGSKLFQKLRSRPLQGCFGVLLLLTGLRGILS